MIAFVQHLVGLTPIIAALLLVRATNVPKAVRVRQFLMPGVAIVYATLALIVFYRLSGWFGSLLELMLQSLPILRDWYSTQWLYVIENTMALVVFVVIKLAMKLLFRRVGGTEDSISGRLAAGVYEYDRDTGLWFVKRRLGTLRLFYRVFYWASIIVTIILIALAETFPGWLGFLSISFPAIGVLVIGELYFAVDGVTKREHQSDIFGEADSADRVAHYGALRRILRETFPDPVLADSVTLSSADATSSYARLDELTHSNDDIDGMAGAYFDRIKQAGQAVDTNLVDASVDLMHGSSVLINDPFYPDLTAYLSFPAYYHLLQYRKCLVICGRDTIADDLVSWLRAGLESITGVPDLWHIELLSSLSRDEPDVGVLRFADVHNLELIRSNDEFFGQVEFVILAEPSRMLTTGQLGLGLVLSRCGRAHAPVFAAFDRNYDGLVDALSHLLKTDLTTVVASALPYGASSEMVWRAGEPHMHSAIMPNVSRYLGVGTGIAAVALKYQVSEVDWVGSDAFPVQDMAWIAGQYYAQIATFAGLEVSQHALSETIVPLINPWNLGRTDNQFLVVEDEISNVYEAVRLYSSRAQKQGFVNVISEDYLLRDYMIANQEIFKADPKAIPSFVSDFARTERNSVLRLVLLLCTFEVSDDDLARELELIGRAISDPAKELGDPGGHEEARENPALAVLRELIATYTGVDDVSIVTALRPMEGGDDDEDAIHEFYRIAPDSTLDAIIDTLRPAYFFVEDEVEDLNYIGAALYGHVYQLMIPGQFVTHAGKYYEVQSVGTAALRNGVVLRRAAEHISGRRVYRQLRRFAVSQLHPSHTVGAQIMVGEAEFIRCFAAIEVTSIGYLDQPTRSDLAGSRRVKVSGIPLRSYPQKELLEIRLPAVPDRVRRTIAVLLNELFVTIFPHSHRFIVALTADPDAECGDLLSQFECEADSGSIFIVEDSLVDLGLLVAVERHRARLFEIIADYLLWAETASRDDAGVVALGETGSSPEETPPPVEMDPPIGSVDYAADVDVLVANGEQHQPVNVPASFADAAGEEGWDSDGQRE